MADSEITIAHLFPDLLGTYSDAGNVEVLAQRLRWRGHRARVLTVLSGVAVPTACDLYVLGGGEDSAQLTAGALLRGTAGLRVALSDRAVTLAVCAGLQLLGTQIVDAEGRRHDGLGVLDLTTAPGIRRTVGEAVARSTLPGVGTLTGFHNHGGATTLGAGTVPLATTVTGPGNGVHDPVEGARTPATTGPGIVGTYLHGPVLARNPDLADHLLGRAVGEPLAPLGTDHVPESGRLRQQYLGGRARRARTTRAVVTEHRPRGAP